MSSETKAEQEQTGQQSGPTRPLHTLPSSHPEYLASSSQQVPRDIRGDVTVTNERVHTTSVNLSPMEERLERGYTTLLPPPDIRLTQPEAASDNLGVYRDEVGAATPSLDQSTLVVVVSDEECGDSRIVRDDGTELDTQTGSDTPTSPSSYGPSPSSSLDLSDLPPSYDSLVSKPNASACVALELDSEATVVNVVEASSTGHTPPPSYDVSLQQLKGQDDKETNSGVSKGEQNIVVVPEHKESSPKKIQIAPETPTTSNPAGGHNILPLTPPPSVPGKREATFPAKRVRKKPCIEEPLPEIAEHPGQSTFDQHQHRHPHVVLTLDDEDMKIQKKEAEKSKKMNSSVEMSVLGPEEKEKKCKSVFFYVEEEELDKHKRRKSSTMNEALKKKYEMEEKECFKNSLENVMRESSRKDLVKEDSPSLNFTGNNRAESDKRYEGQINLGFIGDEGEPATLPVHQPTPKPPPMGSSQQPTFESARRQSDPECLLAVKADDSLFRSRSVGNDLSALNDGSTTLATPTLRKRSLSRGPPDFSTSVAVTDDEKSGEERRKNISFTTYCREGTHKKEDGHEGSTEGSPSLLRRLISSPLLLLSRSESTKKLAPTPSVEDGLCRTPSITWEDNGSRSPRFTGRPPHSPSTITSSFSDYGRHTPRNYILHQHLYRNSRRSVQQKLHRQLSDPHYEHHHHHHHHPHLHHHKKHDLHASRSATHHECHADCPMNCPPTTSSHHTHSPSHHTHSPSHHRAHPNNHSFHHHRSMSQRNMVRPKHHEPLRRMNTYGHESYQNYIKDHEHRCGEQEQQEQGGVEPRVGTARKLSHYRQEEKGSTDVERWVGVHGGGSNGEGEGEQNGVLASPTSPTTPHIIVSTEDDDNTEVANAHEEADPLTTTSNGQVCANSQPPPTLPPVSTTVSTEKPPPDKTMNLISTESPEPRHLALDFASYRKTRRNSMNELYRRMSGSQTNLVPPPLPGQSNLRRSSRTSSRNSLTPSVLDWRQEGNDSLIACVSALYGKLLVVMGMAFPVAEVISHDIPISFYNGFYLYLYIGSIIFLVYAYIFLLQTINLPTTHIKSKFQTLRSYVAMPELNINKVLLRRNTTGPQSMGTERMASRDSRVGSCYDAEHESDRGSVNTLSIKRNNYTLTEGTNHGSMYLKMGAVLFGIGSMIYSGLEVGQYFELQADDSCADILLVISPAARMLFTFIQMYFIFLNSRVAISRHRIIARFGLMHMIGTNLCIWLNVLVQETKHEIINLRFGHGSHDGSTVSAATSGHIIKANDHLMDSAVLGHHDNASHAVESTHAPESTHISLNHTDHSSDHHPIHNLHTATNETHHISRRSATHDQAFSIYECSRSELMGELVDNASPFLFPCTIEYSLLCAGVLYVIWNNINKPVVTYDGDSDISTYVARKARHHYSVDCAHANRGLFMGILILVLTIISLILFFVLINNENYKSLAILEANIIELSVYGVATVTVVIGMIQMRELEFVPDGDIELDNILLLIAQTGVYIYTSFTVIGGHFTMSDQEFMLLPLMSAIITLTQTTLQTIFILDATRRCCYNHDQLERKPGREMVTFLLVCNLAMWAINTFETSRADAHPTQLNFYGIWAWTIISHISMPLAIFYRFHVTVCLCEIWKRSYKLKNEY